MKLNVKLQLLLVLSVVLLVRCAGEDEGEVDVDEDVDVDDGRPDYLKDENIVNYENYVPPTAEYSTDPKIISRDVKCLVCKATIREMELAIKQIDPRKKVDVSGFRMDPAGNSVVKSVQYSKSETYLTELMDTICKTMDDYAKARHKESRKLTVLKLIAEDGTMNPLMSAVDFVQDGDLNKSLEHFCLEVLEDHEEAFLQQFMEETTPKNIDYTICTKTAKYCDEDAPADESTSRDEL